MKKNYKYFWYQERFLNTNTQILSDTTQIMLERTMYLAIILLVVKYWFLNHWTDVKHDAKARTGKLKLIDTKLI